MNYTIDKGSHDSCLIPRIFNKKYFGSYEATISFSEPVKEMQDFYSKLFGYGYLNPLARSERVGWRHIGNNQIGLVAYSDNWGKHSWSREVKADCVYNEKTNMYECDFIFTFKENEIAIHTLGGFVSKGFNRISSFVRVLNEPYFGGNPTADQTYYFSINKMR